MAAKKSTVSKNSRSDDIDRRLDRIIEIQEESARKEAERKIEADRRQAEADRRQAEADRRQAEADRRQAEADRRLAETDRQLQETSLEVKKLSRSIKTLRQHVGGQDNRWSKIVEALVAGDLTALLADTLQIKINYAGTRVKGTYQGDNWEIDVLAVNEGIVVPVEVKTTLSQADIDAFIANVLDKFTDFIPSHRNNKIYGAIAFIKVEGNEQHVVNYAASKGLIVIKAMRGTNHILNAKGYQPRDFNPHN